MADPQVTFEISSPHFSTPKHGSFSVKGANETYNESLVDALKLVQKQINNDLTELIERTEVDKGCKSNQGLKRSDDDLDEESEDDEIAESDKELKKKLKISKK